MASSSRGQSTPFRGVRTPAVYKSLHGTMLQQCTQELHMEGLGQTSAENYVASFLQTHLPEKGKEGVIDQMKVQMVWLDHPGKKVKPLPGPGPPRKKLSSREKKRLGLYAIPKEKQRYAVYLPLHELWKNYMEDLLQIGKGSLSQSQMNQRVTKADLHGCLLRVDRSKCPSYVGSEGIVLQETQNTFNLITFSNKLKIVPKANSVFTFVLGGYCFSLYGNHLRFRAGERSARKFKDKPTTDL